MTDETKARNRLALRLRWCAEKAANSAIDARTAAREYLEHTLKRTHDTESLQTALMFAASQHRRAQINHEIAVLFREAAQHEELDEELDDGGA